jgi:hypothetical protein
MIKPKLMKVAAKGALGLAVSALIGYVVKLELRVEERIDEHFEPLEDQTN